MLVGTFLSRLGQRRLIRNRQSRRLLSDDERKRKALLDALMPSGTTAGRNDNNARKSVKKQTKPLSSFFAQVDALLEKQNKQQQKEQPVSNSFKWKIPEVRKPQHLSTPPRKWTSYLPPSSPAASSTSATAGGRLEKYNETSIFEVFKIPEPPPPRSPNAFEFDSYNNFCELLDATLVEADANDDRRFVKASSSLTNEKKEKALEWLRAEECQVPIQLATLDTAFVECAVATDQARIVNRRKTFSSELRKQARTFMKQLGWDNDQYTFAMHVLRRMLVVCVDEDRALPIPVIWDKLKEAGKLNKNTIGLTLKGSTTFSASALSRNRTTPSSFRSFSGFHDFLTSEVMKVDAKVGQEEREQEEIVPVPDQVAIAHDLLWDPTEQTISIQVRRLVKRRNAKAAEDVIEAFMTGVVKARAHVQVFRLYLELGNVSSAMSIFQKMKVNHPLVPLERELFVQLIAGMAEEGCFCPGSEAVDGAETLGYSPASGPHLFEQLVKEMAEYVVSITSTSAKRLQKAFTYGFHGDDVALTSPLAPLKAVTERADDGALIVNRVRVDSASGICSRSGAKLRLIGLLPEQKDQMKRSLLKLVKNQRRESAMLSFWKWLDSRTGKPFTVILDAANVAYYMQNFDQGQFNYHQVQFVVTALEQIGEHPLVLLPGRYAQPSFTLTLGTSDQPQIMSESDRKILKNLRDGGKLWTVPPGCLDDYFWILASVSNQTKSRNGQDLQVSHDEGNNRWPGGRPVVVTNDQIRDHMLNLLEPKIFNRWYSNTMVNYNFTGFVGDHCIDPEIVFSPADFFSREIQGNQTEDPGSGAAWHFPVEDWEPTDWFCVRLPNTLKGNP